MEVSATVQEIANHTKKVSEDASMLTALSDTNAVSTKHVAALTADQLTAQQQFHNYIKELRKVSKVLQIAVKRFRYNLIVKNNIEKGLLCKNSKEDSFCMATKLAYESVNVVYF